MLSEIVYIEVHTQLHSATRVILPNFEKFQFEMVKNGEKWWKMVNIFYGELAKWKENSPFFTIFHHFLRKIVLNFAFFLSHRDILNIQNNILNYQLALFTNIKYLTNV